MTVQEFAQKHGVSQRTVYRWIESGKVHGIKIDDTWKIDDNVDMTNDMNIVSVLRQQIEQLQSENEYLRNKLDQSQDEAHEDRLRTDTIIMQLTKQLEQQTLLIEDMRHRSLWTRVKTALGFA